MTKKPDREKEELTELAKLLQTGKLNIRLDEEGTVIPEDEDLKEVEDNYPDASRAKKWQLAQACAMIRAKREYDHRIATEVNIETFGLE